MGDLLLWGSALFQVVRHIKFNRESDSDSEAAIEANEPAGENQNLFETKGPDANKIEAESK